MWKEEKGNSEAIIQFFDAALSQNDKIWVIIYYKFQP